MHPSVSDESSGLLELLVDPLQEIPETPETETRLLMSAMIEW
jgi:hypothetical protein